jgi:hypothetical protein
VLYGEFFVKIDKDKIMIIDVQTKIIWFFLRVNKKVSAE